MKQIKRFFKIYLILVVLFVLQKPLFMLLTHASAAQPLEDSFSTMLAVIWHGLQLDLSMAGYLTAIPALLLLASIWIKEEIIRPVFSIYFGIIAVFMSFCFVLNIALYPLLEFSFGQYSALLFLHIACRCLCQYKHLGGPVRIHLSDTLCCSYLVRTLADHQGKEKAQIWFL